MKNSISICSNSRVRKMKLPGVISLRNALPTWPMPNGGFLRDGGDDVARSSRRCPAPSRGGGSAGPTRRRRRRGRSSSRPENAFGSVYWPFVPQFGHGTSARPFSAARPLRASKSSMRLSARNRLWQLQALDERVGEGRDVAGCLPHALGQDDRRVEAHHVAAAAHERLPPLAADVLLELGAEWAVVPRRAGSAVDLARLEDEPAVAGEGDDFVEAGLLGHGGSNGRVGWAIREDGPRRRHSPGCRGVGRRRTGARRHPSILAAVEIADGACRPALVGGAIELAVPVLQLLAAADQPVERDLEVQAASRVDLLDVLDELAPRRRRPRRAPRGRARRGRPTGAGGSGCRAGSRGRARR